MNFSMLLKRLFLFIFFCATFCPVFADDVYVKVTDVSQLNSSDQYIIVYEDGENSKAMGQPSANFMGGVNVVVRNNTIVVSNESPLEFNLFDKTEKNNKVYYRFKSGSQYLNLPNASETYLNLVKNKSDLSYWNIDLNSETPISNKGSISRNIRWNNSSTFRAYSGAYSESSPVALYVKVGSGEAITVSKAAEGLSTYVPSNALDFSSLNDFFAYTASVSGNTVTFNKIDAVPAGTPILVRSTAADAKSADRTVAVPVISSADAVAGNILEAGTGVALQSYENGYLNYVLSRSSQTGAVGFYLANGNTVPTNRAYLKIEGTLDASANTFIGFAEGSFTGINTISLIEKKETDTPVYNLNGQKVGSSVAGLSKGIYITGGKKIILK